MELFSINEMTMTAIKKYWPYIFILLPSLAFAAAGIGKLMGVPELHASFSAMGMPNWFGYFIGACELAGAVGLYLGGLRKLAAAGLAIIMAGATYFHIAYSVPSPVPAIILLAMMVFVIAWNWRDRKVV